MKRTILPSICILLCALFATLIPTEAEAAIYDDTLRLHILAPSDSAEDQNLKLLVRDMVLEKYSYLLKKCSSAASAEAELSKVITDIKAECEAVILNTGYNYSVDVAISKEWFDTKDYKGFSLPCGIYNALIITLGEGEGQNWWCVMYPPMCLDVCTADQSGGAYNGAEEKYTQAEDKLIRRRDYNVKFKLLEVASLVLEK